MKLLIIGNGGREHALGWSLKKDKRVTELYFAPGNAGTLSLGQNVPINTSDLPGLIRWAQENKPDLVVVGPEAPLCLGLVDQLEALGVPAFGPNKSGARLEASKTFTKNLLLKSSIPTAASAAFTKISDAKTYCASQNFPLVIKADGLAAGKGVIIAQNVVEAESALTEIMERKVFGSSGDQVLIEEFLEGQEASIHAVTDGKDYILMPSSQDHKRVFDQDLGPNTGGMGAYAPAPIITPDLLKEIEALVIRPIIQGLREAGIDYRGVLYAGLMLTPKGPKVLEFNCRFGDPETEVLLPLLITPLLDVILATLAGNLGSLQVKISTNSALTVVLAAPGYPESPLVGGEISLSSPSQGSDALIFHAGTEMKDGKTLSTGGRVMAVTGVGCDLAAAAQKAYSAVHFVHFDGMHYRKDIGRKAFDLLASS
jgi:phosphoribosylamine---glycine ligase